jgi:hypothetical protein
MSLFLLDKDHYYEDINTHGWKNLISFLDAMDMVIYVLEYPEDSVCWLRFHNDRLDGMQPTESALSAIVNRYFTMSIVDFFSKEIIDDTFDNFLEECFKSCASLSYPQVFEMYQQMLFIHDINRLQH